MKLTARRRKIVKSSGIYCMRLIGYIINPNLFSIAYFFVPSMAGTQIQIIMHAKRIARKNTQEKKIAVHNLSGEQFSFNENRKKKRLFVLR